MTCWRPLWAASCTTLFTFSQSTWEPVTSTGVAKGLPAVLRRPAFWATAVRVDQGRLVGIEFHEEVIAGGRKDVHHPRTFYREGQCPCPIRFLVGFFRETCKVRLVHFGVGGGPELCK